MNNIIEIKNLRKSFGEIKAVDDLSFHVKSGELFAFLGVNGAGKSTTINILCGQLPRDGGTVLIEEADPKNNRDSVCRKLGVVFQSSVLDSQLSVRDNLLSRAALYGLHGKAAAERLSYLSKLLQFENLLNRKVGKLSGGQRRRIDIARALIHSPKILILDEPTTGLDPQTRTLLWQVISELRQSESMTVFLTTHYMEEAADADYVVILDHGRLAAEGTPLELKNAYTGDYITLYGISNKEAESLGVPFETLQDGYRFAVDNTAKATEMIVKQPEIFRDYEIVKGRMDDVFLAVTGKRLNGGAAK